MFPHLLGRRGPGRYIAPGSGSGDSDGGFEEPAAISVTVAGDTTITGKVKPGSFGKFVYPLAVIAAGRQYTFRYTPSFTRLAQQGRLAMVGFGLKSSNDFHIVGLRGDGTTGLHKYKVNGTSPNGWNKETGHTTSDGGASANGTQAGPNWIRLITSADGTTYIFQTSTNGTSWTNEYSGSAPTPFSNVSSVTTFGLALWFNNADAGPFSIFIDRFSDEFSILSLSPTAWYDPSDLTTLWQDSGRTTPVLVDGDPVGCIDDKSGNGRNLTQTVSGSRPLYKTSGGLHWLDFDGTDDYVDGAAITNFIAVGAYEACAGFRADTIDTNTGLQSVSGDSGSFFSIGYLRNLGNAGTAGTAGTVGAYNWDGNSDTVTTAYTVAADGLISQRHDTGNVYIRLNSGTEVSVASGNTQSVLFAFEIGRGSNVSSACIDGRVYGFFIKNAVLATQERSDLRTWMAGKSGVTL